MVIVATYATGAAQGARGTTKEDHTRICRHAVASAPVRENPPSARNAIRTFEQRRARRRRRNAVHAVVVIYAAVQQHTRRRAVMLVIRA